MTSAMAIMQPYLFPYVGYFNLVASASKFVFYDDVSFIKSGWINRNRILLNGAVHSFTCPVTVNKFGAAIADVRVADLPRFRSKFLKTLEHAYTSAPFFVQGMGYAENVLSSGSDRISELAAYSVMSAMQCIEVDQTFEFSSRNYPTTSHLRGAQRIIAIVRAGGCGCYINSIGGQALYDQALFEQNGLQLQFIQPRIQVYPQVGVREFCPKLSIIDLLMNLSIEQIRQQLASYELNA